MQYINYNEVKQRGTIDFPLEFYHVTRQHPRYVMPYHWHAEYEIIRLLDGSAAVHLDENEFIAEKGDIILIKGGTLHACTPNSSSGCIYECIVFDMDMLLKENDICQKYIQGILSNNIVLDYYYPNQEDDIHKIVWKLFDAAKLNKAGYQLIVKGLLYELIGALLIKGCYNTNAVQTPVSQRRILQLKEVLKVIESSYDSPITLDELSKAAGMSPKYFCRFFKEMTHRTPIDYLNYYRIECACQRLLAGDMSIKQIAYNFGFNSLSYFIKTFKKYKGMTPKKYVQSNANYTSGTGK